MGVGVGRWSEYAETMSSLVSFHETRRERKERHIRTLTLPKHEPPIPPSSPIKSTQRTTDVTPRNHNRMRSPHVHGEPKGGGEVPEMLLFFLDLVVRAGHTPPAPFAVEEGGGEAELEEGGRDLERERDAGEGVWWWVRGGRRGELRGRRRRRVVAHRTAYRWEGRVE